MIAPPSPTRRVVDTSLLFATRLLIAAALAFGSGCASADWIDRTLVTENVTDTWPGSFGEAASFRFVQLDVQHQGPNVTGFIRLLPSGSSTGYQDRRAPIEGSVAGDVFTFKDARGSYSGELTIGGDEMSGRIFGPQGNPPSLPPPREFAHPADSDATVRT